MRHATVHHCARPAKSVCDSDDFLPDDEAGWRTAERSAGNAQRQMVMHFRMIDAREKSDPDFQPMCSVDEFSSKLTMSTQWHKLHAKKTNAAPWWTFEPRLNGAELSPSAISKISC